MVYDPTNSGAPHWTAFTIIDGLPVPVDVYQEMIGFIWHVHPNKEIGSKPGIEYPMNFDVIVSQNGGKPKIAGLYAPDGSVVMYDDWIKKTQSGNSVTHVGTSPFTGETNLLKEPF